MTFPCIKWKIHKYTNTQIHKYKVLKRPYNEGQGVLKAELQPAEVDPYLKKKIKCWVQCLKYPTCAMFLKIMGFKDIKYNIPVYQM